MKTILGLNPCVDEGVILGYDTGREIQLAETVIGDSAVIRSHTVIYCNVKIGDNLETGHNVVIREENTIGDDFRIWNNSTVDYGCQIGHHVRIHSNVYVAQFTTIEDEVFIAPGVMIANDPHPICTKCMQGPTIRREARIGINTTLLPRIVIGERALIGAGSVVTTDIPDGMLAYGNPARVIKPVDDLSCPPGIVAHPYVEGRDIRSQECAEFQDHASLCKDSPEAIDE
jgi:acetyltransferase-like isoleucine patch superfamily enzyme